MRDPNNLSGGFSGFIRVPFFREAIIVAAVLRRFSRILVHGVNSISLRQKRNYMQHVSTPTEISRKSWQRTGDMLRASMERVGGECVARDPR